MHVNMMVGQGYLDESSAISPNRKVLKGDLILFRFFHIIPIMWSLISSLMQKEHNVSNSAHDQQVLYMLVSMTTGTFRSLIFLMLWETYPFGMWLDRTGAI